MGECPDARAIAAHGAAIPAIGEVGAGDASQVIGEGAGVVVGTAQLGAEVGDLLVGDVVPVGERGARPLVAERVQEQVRFVTVEDAEPAAPAARTRRSTPGASPGG